MQYRQLGSSGLKISALSFGAWVTLGRQLNDPTSRALMHAAYDAGVNFFDNAEGYAGGQAERVMGTILKRSKWRRSSYLVSSKVFFGAGDRPNETGLSRKHVIEACHEAMRRLQVDYIDLYYCHRPDPSTPIVETCRAMHDLITQGKVLYWGTSEWGAAALTEAFEVCDRLALHAPVVEQPQYNILSKSRFEKQLTPVLKARGMGTTTWSPLASGLLTGKYNNGFPSDSRLGGKGMEWLQKLVVGENGAEKFAAVKALGTIADGIDTTLPRMAIAWCLKNPHVSSVILGASRTSQLEENFAAFEVVDRLTPAVMRKIAAAAKPVSE